MGAIADIFGAVHLNLETGEFEASAAKAADSVGSSMSQQLGSKLKSAVGAGIGMVAGAAFSMALTGANELDAATKQLQADTGMTAEEAKNAEHALAGMYKTNLQGFDEIGATMAVVVNGLHLTGDAAAAATQQFLTFATATGQNAADAVSAIRGDLDAWNLTAADAGPLMDKLVASHQKFGIVVTEDQAALQAMAPAMQAANMSVDDGIALLNLFQTAGISAAKAPAALAIAVKQLKPGQNLNDLIAQIGAIQDPTLRAQAAMNDFGARAGAQLAQAIKPGMTSLDDLIASLGDTAGASDTAAGEIKSGFGEQFQLILHNATGWLAEFGTNFGGIIGIASEFGPRFTTALLAGLGGLGGLLIPKITAAILSATLPAAVAGEAVGAAAGTALPGAFAAAAALAFPAVIGAFIIAAGTMIALALNDLFPGLAKKMHDQFFAGVDAVTTALKGSSSILDDTGNGFNSLGVRVDATSRTFGRVPPVVDAAGTALKGFADASTAAGGAVGGLAAATVSGFSELADANLKAARAYVTSSQASKLWSDDFRRDMQATAPALNTAKDDFNSFLDTLGIGPARAKLQGELTGAKLAAGLKTGSKASRAAGAEMVQTLTDQLNGLTKPMSAAAQKAELEGELLAMNHARGIAKAAGDPTRMALIDTMIGSVRQKMLDLAGLTYSYGFRAGASYTDGVAAGIVNGKRVIVAAVNQLHGVVYAKSPPGPESPLHEIDKWGAGTGQAWVDSFAGAIAGGKSGIMGALGGLAMPGVAGGSFAMPYAAARPDFSAQATRAGAAVLSTRGGDTGPTYNVTVNNPEPRAAGPDIGRVLRRTAALGMT